MTYIKKGDLDSAISDFDQVIQINPDYAVAYFNRGQAYNKKDDWDRAISDFDRAIQINPNNPVFYYIRGLAYYDKGETENARADLKKTLIFAVTTLYCALMRKWYYNS